MYDYILQSYLISKMKNNSTMKKTIKLQYPYQATVRPSIPTMYLKYIRVN